MQPPIPDGIILNKRYRIVKVLGAGGFGRTYLAEDTSRYDEKCVLKEYNPNLEETYALEKSQELFEREAQILYKIEHPRIPKFQATFEQGKRLFLAQDYVEGKTYKTLLEERVKENKQFTPAEVVQFLQQMLRVLEHIHSKGIIHRDISPDNIICRQSDRLPVLIDFGAVKETGTTPLQESGKSIQGTNVGKHGYSPPEQLQMGKVYHNSDLYSLAATAVVLMTGRKPEELLNKQTMTWRWHQWVPTLELWLAQLLNKMLSPKPDNRYQSAAEVAQELRSRTGGLVGTASRGNAIMEPASNSVKQNSQKSNLSDRAATPSLTNSR
ncbi:MAG: serine/threonine protein kinase [Hormoscilla sp.]